MFGSHAKRTASGLPHDSLKSYQRVVMLRLNLFGAVDLVDAEGRSKGSDIGGNKPLALLAYLVIEGRHGPIRRDVAATVLWPESEQRYARQSLTQAIHQLRNSLGDVITSHGQEALSIDRKAVGCDCFEFQDLARDGLLEQAVALYRGEFAAGLYVREAPEFDEWVSRQRKFWRDSFAAVLLKLFEASVQRNDFTKAAVWAENLLEVAPEDDKPVRTLLPLLKERGQAPTALRLYEKYKRAMAEAFDIEPAADIKELVANFPTARRTTASRPTSVYVGEPTSWRRPPLKATVITAAALAGTVLLITLLLDALPSKATGSNSTYELSPPKVAVLPFAYTGSAQNSASVLNEALQWRLRNAGFEVLNAGDSDTSAIRKLVGTNEQSGMMFIVGGDVESELDGSLVARLWLRDAGTGKRVWESQFEQQVSNAHLIATQLSDAITSQMRRAAGDGIELVSGTAKVSAESWKDVYRARERMEAAMDMRRQGAAAGSETELKDAEITLIQVSRREPDWPLPWILRGRLADARAFTAMLRGDAKKGGEELNRGIRLLDSVASRLQSEDVYEMRGLLLYRRWIFGVEDVAVASRLLNRAAADLRKAFGPGRDNSASYATLSGVMFAQGKYSESFVYARRAYDTNVFLRSNEEVLSRLFNSALHAGDDAAANQWCKELQNAQPGNWPAVMCRVHIAGFAPNVVNVGTLEREIEQVVAPPAIRQLMTPRLKAAYAITLAQLGQSDSARAILATVAESKDPEVILFSAFALAALKDAPQAHAVLRNYLAENRGTRSTALHMRWLN
jgi:DNA-binding SARP family transcriptional activator